MIGIPRVAELLVVAAWGAELPPPPTATLRSLDLVALTRIVPMGFGNARHGCKSTEEHECEDDDSLHLISPFSLSLLAYDGDNSGMEAHGIKLQQERASSRHEGPDRRHQDAGMGRARADRREASVIGKRP